MIIPVNKHVLVEVDKPDEEQDGFIVSDTSKYTRLNRGKISKSPEKDWKEGTRIFFQDFQGVEVDKNLIVLHIDDIVAYEQQ